MKFIFTSICFLFVFANCEKPSDCIKSTGKITSKVYEDVIFTRIIVNKGIGLVITQGENYKVRVQTGENLINDIEVNFSDNTLTLEDNTSCNWVRDYGETVVYITAPNLTDIFCKTEQNISSNGVLNYSYLHLVSMNTIDGYKGIGTGDYILDLNCDNLFIENNNVSRYFITGKVKDMSLNFYEDGGIFYGENLLINRIQLYHRGTNDMFLSPLESISGALYNVGNVICYTKPGSINVVQHYKGKLIFN